MMSSLKNIVSGLLLSTFSFSTCVGGVLSTSSVFVSRVMAQTVVHEEMLMSPALEVGTCLALSPFDRDADVSHADHEGCGGKNGPSCFSRSHSDNGQRMAVAPPDVAEQVPVSPFAALSGSGMEDERTYFARAGPVFHDAFAFAYTVVRRE